MTKRIVSGVFILTALGALGVILAGALSSGEQLIVRFLTAVIVAALGLYVISDLRLQADEDLASAKPRNLAKLTATRAPMDSTAAFMATATQSSKSRMARGFSFTDTQNAAVSGPLSAMPDKNEAMPVKNEMMSDENEAMPVKNEMMSDENEMTSIDSYFSADSAVTDASRAYIDQDLGAASSSTTEQESAVVEGAGSPPTTSGHSQGEPAVVDVFADQIPADEFAWPMPPSHPDSKASVARFAGEAPVGAQIPALEDQANSQAATSLPSRSKPDGYRVEVTGNTPASQGAPGKAASVESTSLAASTTGSWARSKHFERAVSAADYADAPLAPIIDLRGPTPVEPEIEAAIRAGEIQVVATLIEQGMLSTSGPVTDREVRTMVYVAFTSNELRKLLRAGRSSSASPTDDLGPVELFDPLLHRPAPARLYSQSPSQFEEAQSQLG